jgi:hypothetical protein
MAASSVAVFHQRREDIDEHGGQPSMNLFYRDGQYWREEIIAERVERALEMVDSDLDYIQGNCRLIPSEGERDLPAEYRQLQRLISDRSFFDPILAAEGAKKLLVCEDQSYRNLATEFGVNGTWLQPILMFARESGVLSRGAYSEAIIGLVDAGHRFASIDSEVLWTAANKEGKGIGRPFMAVADTLGVPTAEMVSHIKVAGGFLRRVWSAADPPLRQVVQSGTVLECLLRGRPDSIEGICGGLLETLPRSARRRFGDYLKDWLQGHFLLVR